MDNFAHRHIMGSIDEVFVNYLDLLTLPVESVKAFSGFSKNLCYNLCKVLLRPLSLVGLDFLNELKSVETGRYDSTPPRAFRPHSQHTCILTVHAWRRSYESELCQPQLGT